MTKNSKIRRFVGWSAAIAFVAALTAGASFAQAQAGTQQNAPPAGPRTGMRGPMGMMGGPMMRLQWLSRQLNLTADQQQQIKTIVQGNMPTLQPLFQQMQLARQSLAQATLTTTPNDAAIQQAAQQVAAATQQLTVAGAKIAAQVYSQVLTPDQQQRAQALLQQWQQRAAQRHQGGGHR